MKLRMNALSKAYHDRVVLNVPGCTLGSYGLEGLIGPNGAGKSTLMGLLTRRIGATTGTINFELDEDDHDLMPLQSFEVARLGLVKTNQRIQDFAGLSIRDSLRLAATPPERETIKSVVKEPGIDPKIEEEIEKYLEHFKFTDPDGHALSGGEKKLLDIIRCLILKPRMLLMDEPTAGLPEDLTQEVVKLVAEKVKAGEMRVVIVEHDLDLIWNNCEYVHFLSEGEFLFQGTPEEVKANRVVAEKYMGL